LRPLRVSVKAATFSVGPIISQKHDWDFAQRHPLRFLDPDLAEEAEAYVLAAKERGDSVGSVVELRGLGLPPGWGDPVFDKLEANLGRAFFSIGAVRAVEFGEGLALSQALGSQAQTLVTTPAQNPFPNPDGGILGGISTGRFLSAKLYIKPTPSIAIEQEAEDIKGQKVKLTIKGRHDPCLAPRLGPVAEAMCLIVLADYYLRGSAKLSKIQPDDLYNSL
jgi:chorismate synthase